MKSFADLLEVYFQETAQAIGIEEKHFRIAGRDVTFQFAGERWSKEMTGAIAHLETPCPSNPTGGLSTAMWDGSREPENHLLRAYLFTLTNWWFHYTGPRGTLLDIHSDRMAATYDPGTGTLNVVDLDRNRAFYWKRDASPMPYWESCYPFRSLLHSWMRDANRYFVHGAGVGFADGGVILSGKSGAGKSTSALACLASALQFAGDENCIVEALPSGRFEIHGLYATAKVIEMEDLHPFPGIETTVVNPRREPGDKVAVSLAASRAEKLIDRFPLCAILVPVITGRVDTIIAPCSPHEALKAIAPETLSQLPASGRKDLKFFGDLVRRVPCHQILLGTDLRQVPEKISELLHAAGVQGEVSVGPVHV